MFWRSLAGLAASAGVAFSASLQSVEDFGDNPTKITMQIYVPDELAPSPPVIVALHGCGMTGQMLYGISRLPEYADENGFVLIYPSTPNMDRCWGVQDPNSLTHDAGGDSAGVISMVNYALEKYDGDKDRVYVMGISSGGMMTNVLAATYPEVFEAGAAYSGTPHACFAGAPLATPASPNQTCAEGNLHHTPEEWGNFVRNSYPGYTGRRPRMQIWHGLADLFVHFNNGYEALKQWSDVLEVELTKNITGVPSEKYTEMIYGDGTKLQGYFGEGVGHTVPVQEEPMLEFFGIL